MYTLDLQNNSVPIRPEETSAWSSAAIGSPQRVENINLVTVIALTALFATQRPRAPFVMLPIFGGFFASVAALPQSIHRKNMQYEYLGCYHLESIYISHTLGGTTISRALQDSTTTLERCMELCRGRAVLKHTYGSLREPYVILDGSFGDYSAAD